MEARQTAHVTRTERKELLTPKPTVSKDILRTEGKGRPCRRRGKSETCSQQACAKGTLEDSLSRNEMTKGGIPGHEGGGENVGAEIRGSERAVFSS